MTRPAAYHIPADPSNKHCSVSRVLSCGPAVTRLGLIAVAGYITGLSNVGWKKEA